MKTEISICNRALAYLGLAPITSFTENSREAQVLHEVYPVVRDELLERFDFSFATKIERLAHVKIKEEHKKGYLYQLPSYCLRVREVFTQDEYRFTNARTILCQSPELIVEMTIQLSDMSVCSAIFIEALVCRIVSAIAIPLTGNSGIATDFYSRYHIAFEEAQCLDKVPHEDGATSSWIHARQ